MKHNVERFLTGIFCDDIRHEVGQKLSFMGCYQSELLVPSMPIVLPKLCVYVSISTPKGKPFKALTLRVVQDDDSELARIEMPMEGLTQAAKIRDKTATRKTINSAIEFAPFVIEKPTTLRLMATTEEGEIVGPRLLIKLLPEQATPVMLATSDTKPSKPRGSKPKSAAKKPVSKT